MTTVDSWWTLDGWCYFLVDYGWLLLFPGGQMVGAFFLCDIKRHLLLL